MRSHGILRRCASLRRCTRTLQQTIGFVTWAPFRVTDFVHDAFGDLHVLRLANFDGVLGLPGVPPVLKGGSTCRATHPHTSTKSSQLHWTQTLPRSHKNAICCAHALLIASTWAQWWVVVFNEHIAESYKSHAHILLVNLLCAVCCASLNSRTARDPLSRRKKQNVAGTRPTSKRSQAVYCTFHQPCGTMTSDLEARRQVILILQSDLELFALGRRREGSGGGGGGGGGGADVLPRTHGIVPCQMSVKHRMRGPKLHVSSSALPMTPPTPCCDIQVSEIEKVECQFDVVCSKWEVFCSRYMPDSLRKARQNTQNQKISLPTPYTIWEWARNSIGGYLLQIVATERSNAINTTREALSSSPCHQRT